MPPCRTISGFSVAMLHWTASIPGKVTTSSTRVGNIRNEFPVGAFCKENYQRLRRNAGLSLPFDNFNGKPR